MPREGTNFSSCLQIPEFDRIVQTTTRQGLTISAKIDAHDITCMPREGANFSSCFRIPDFDQIVSTTTC